MTTPAVVTRWAIYDGATLLGTYTGSRSSAWFQWARAAGFVGVYPGTMRDEEIGEPEQPAPPAPDGPS